MKKSILLLLLILPVFAFSQKKTPKKKAKQTYVKEDNSRQCHGTTKKGYRCSRTVNTGKITNKRLDDEVDRVFGLSSS